MEERDINTVLAELLGIPKEPFTSSMTHARKVLKAAVKKGVIITEDKHPGGESTYTLVYGKNRLTLEVMDARNVAVQVCRMVYLALQGGK